MVAHYENLRDMIFELNVEDLFWQEDATIKTPKLHTGEV